jgi:hypothetical protein
MSVTEFLAMVVRDYNKAQNKNYAEPVLWEDLDDEDKWDRIKMWLILESNHADSKVGSEKDCAGLHYRYTWFQQPEGSVMVPGSEREAGE